MRRIATLFAIVAGCLIPLLGASGCGGLQNEVETPVREATQQVEKARDVQQQVEEIQQQQVEEGQ